MTKLGDMGAALRHSLANNERVAVATVIATVGSVYRRAGAQSLVFDDGTVMGVVSGGCVEADLYEHAQDVWTTGVGKKINYDFRDAGDEIWGMGLGCNGAVTVWLQPLNPASHSDLAHALVAELSRREEVTTASCVGMVVESENPDIVALGQLIDLDAAAVDIDAGLGTQLRSLASPAAVLVRTVIDGTDVELFVERLVPRPRLLVYGAGEDARVLAQAVVLLDWKIEVVDHRSSFATEQRFPNARKIHLVAREDYGQVPVDNRTYAVVMTHHYEYDVQIVKSLMTSAIPYLGLLGPKNRREKILADVTAAGIDVSEHDMEKLHGPIGIDIGAETPEEIAISIVTEVVAVRNQRAGGFLRNRDGAIHHDGDLLQL